MTHSPTACDLKPSWSAVWLWHHQGVQKHTDLVLNRFLLTNHSSEQGFRAMSYELQLHYITLII